MGKKTASKSPGVVEAIFANNAGRDPERLAMKYAKMAQSPFAFLRGSCHLFYAALPRSRLFRKAPLAWCCGDLHFENVGSYKGDNRQVYFDINDYDDAALAPVTWDIVRLLTSIECGADMLNATRAEARATSKRCIDAYRNGLTDGKPLWVERETSTGLVNDLLTALRDRPRPDFLDSHTVKKGRRRRLKIDGVKAQAATDTQKQLISAFMDRYAATRPDPRFFKIVDIARRIAGTGSLGVERFIVLIEGKGSPNGNYLLDIKEAKPSALIPRLSRLGVKQPQWPDEASRVVSIQKRMQAVNHAFLQAVSIGGTACIMKALQTAEDRVDIGAWGKHPDRLEEVAATMGQLLAWDQLRASGRSGSAKADALIAFAQGRDWVEETLEAAEQMAQTTRMQWKVFTEAYRRRMQA